MKNRKRKPGLKRSLNPWGWILIAIVTLTAIGFAILQTKPPPDTTNSSEITVAQAAELRDQGAFILDVREPDEWVQFHIPGSTLIPLGDLPNRLSEVPTGQKIVVVCNSGNRSTKGRDILLQAGFMDVTSMAGGVSRWKTQGLPIVTGE